MNEHGILIGLLRAAWQAGVVANEHRIVVALLNAVWQSAVIALFAIAALRLAPRMSANARCTVWTLAFFVVAAFPALDFALVRTVAATPSQTLATAQRPVDQRRSRSGPVVLIVADERKGPAWAASPTRRTPETAPLSVTGVDIIPSPQGSTVTLLIARLVDRAGTLLFWAWLIGAGAFGVRLCLQLYALLRAKGSVVRTDFTDEFLQSASHARAYTIGVSDRLEVPCLLGLLQPVIAIPRSLVRRISPADLTRIVLHESAHIRRYDDWFNFFEQVVLAVAFFNPVLHYIVRCTNLEREIACDDAVTVRADRLRYAECLSALAAQARLGGALIAPGLFEGRRQLLVRIEQLLDAKHCASTTLGRIPYVAMSLTTMLAVVLCQVGIPVLAAERGNRVPAARVRALSAFQTIRHKARPSVRAVVSQRVAPHPLGASESMSGRLTPHIPQLKRDSPAPHLAVRVPHRPTLSVPVPVAPPARIHISVVTSARQAPAMSHQPSVYRVYADNSPAIALSQPRVSDVSPIALAAAAAPASRSVLLIYPKNGNLDGPENAGLRSYIKALRAAGYTVITTHDASMLLDHDVSVTYARAMHAAGLGLDSAASALAKLRDHDVSAEYARSMKELLHSQADWQALSGLRDHSVDASLAKAMSELSRAQALSDMDLRALGHLGDHGVSAGYLREMIRTRYSGKLPCPDTATRELSQLRDHGVDAAYIGSLAAVGYTGLSVRDLIRLRDHGVSADFIQRMRSARHNALLSVDELIRLRDLGGDGH
ncbi:MAG: M56 family metallopeptidase [Candidatus Eremiobacteraeota bacterium]|nr:M56 family metallopeptidase [Candidatus Eremiobacteraeota bacterium]